MYVSRLSALRSGCLYPAADIPDTGMIPGTSGIKAATFWLVANALEAQ